jgi:hypothetical protein
MTTTLLALRDRLSEAELPKLPQTLQSIKRQDLILAAKVTIAVAVILGLGAGALAAFSTGATLSSTSMAIGGNIVSKSMFYNGLGIGLLGSAGAAARIAKFNDMFSKTETPAENIRRFLGETAIVSALFTLYGGFASVEGGVHIPVSILMTSAALTSGIQTIPTAAR